MTPEQHEQLRQDIRTTIADCLPDQEAREEAYDRGRSEGYDDGHQEGYQRAVEDATDEGGPSYEQMRRAWLLGASTSLEVTLGWVDKDELIDRLLGALEERRCSAA